VNFVVQPFCDHCGLPFEGAITGAFECTNCRDQSLAFRHARAAVRMTDLVQDVIHRYKYNYSLWFEPFLVDLMERASQGSIRLENFDAIVPIPLHWRKRYHRQYNQAQRLARALARRTGVPLRAELLKRVKPTPTQTRLSRKERAANVKNAFLSPEKHPATGLRIVLVDDVLTTGATASACAKALMDNGAKFVDVWTVARGMLK
jgi:ComF family protein